MTMYDQQGSAAHWPVCCGTFCAACLPAESSSPAAASLSEHRDKLRRCSLLALLK